MGQKSAEQQDALTRQRQAGVFQHDAQKHRGVAVVSEEFRKKMVESHASAAEPVMAQVT
jgi:hypothetical protein